MFIILFSQGGQNVRFENDDWEIAPFQGQGMNGIGDWVRLDIHCHRAIAWVTINFSITYILTYVRMLSSKKL